MATKKTNSRKTSNQTPWGWIAAVALLVVLIGTNLTGVNTVRGDLAQVQAQLTAQSAATTTLAPATVVVPATPSSTATIVAPTATIEAPTQASAQPTPQMTVADERIQHLLSLQPSYESGGWQAWLRAAGVNFDSSKVESRQPLEEMLNGNLTVVGLVIRATDLQVNWPSCLTTDRPNEVKTSSKTKQHQPDLTNPSVMYTNIVLNGQGAVYADCSDWGQLDPTK
jgi:hypothetical protein